MYRKYMTDEEKMEALISKEVEEPAIEIDNERPSVHTYEGWTYHYE